MQQHGGKIFLPKDVVCARSLRRDATLTVKGIDEIGAVDRIVDIGPKTREAFAGVLAGAGTILWNGPLGYCEVSSFCAGTRDVARAIAAQTGRATTVVGGGDTLPVIETLGLADKFTLLSTGGAALLQFLAGQELPGVEAVRA